MPATARRGRLGKTGTRWESDRTMFEAGLIALLQGNAALMATIQAGPLPVLVPEGTAYPALSYQSVTEMTYYTLSGRALQDRRVQFDACATSELACKNVVLALRNLLSAYAGTLTDGTRVLGTFRENVIDAWEV